jgi:hypothetical protein
MTFERTTMTRLATATAALCAMLTLTACGGGGSSDTPSGGTLATAQVYKAQLTREQLRSVAAAVYSDIGAAKGVGASAVSTYGSMSTLFGYANQTFACGTGNAGTFAISVTDRGTVGKFDAGDVIAIKNQNCNFASNGFAQTTQGTQTMTLDAGASAPVAGAAWSAKITFDWTDLRSKPNNSLLGTGFNGATTITVDTAADGTSTATSVTNGLTLAHYADAALGGVPTGTAVSSLSYESFTLVYKADATGASASINGRTVYRQPQDPSFSPVTTTYATTTPFRTDATGHPVQGDIRSLSTALRPLMLNGQTVVAGIGFPASAAFRWVVLNATTLRLDADENGDGISDSSTTFTFAEITS